MDMAGNARRCAVALQVLSYPTVAFHAVAVERVDVIPPKGGSMDGDHDSVLSTDSSHSTSTSRGDMVRPGQQPRCAQLGCHAGPPAAAPAPIRRIYGCWQLGLPTWLLGSKGAMPALPAPAMWQWQTALRALAGCTGYENRDEALAALGNGERGVHLALEMRQLSRCGAALHCASGPVPRVQAGG